MALGVLENRCQRYHWFRDPYVNATDPGLDFGFTVVGRDQWWCHVRGMRLASEVYVALQLSPSLMPVPHWEEPEGHREPKAGGSRTRY